jgi:hypothetical protein
MPTLNLFLDGDNCWPDLHTKELIHLGNDAPPIGLAVLPGGMLSGRTSVSFRIDLPDGRVVIAETSFALLDTAVRTIKARYGE